MQLLLLNLISILIIICVLLIPYIKHIELFDEVSLYNKRHPDGIHNEVILIHNETKPQQKKKKQIIRKIINVPQVELPKPDEPKTKQKETLLTRYESAPPPQISTYSPCTCNCAELQKQLDNACNGIKDELDKCNLALMSAQAKCEDSKSQIQMNSLKERGEFEAQISTLKNKQLEMNGNLLTAKADTDALKNDNIQLIKQLYENASDVVRRMEVLETKMHG